MRLRNIFFGNLIVLVLILSGCSGSGDGGTETEPVESLSENTSLVANAISLSTSRDITISSNFDVVDADNRYLIYEIVEEPSSGTLVVENEYNIFTYTPNVGFIGNDSFIYRAYDGENYSNEVNVTIEVTEVEVVSQTDVLTPSIPVIISINSPSSDSITLFWSSSSDSDTASDDMIYEIHISQEENFVASQSTKKLSIKGAQEATVSELDESTLYFVKVKAVDLGANSAISNEMSIQTSTQNSVILNSLNIIQVVNSLFLNNVTVEDSSITYTLDEKVIPPQEGDILVGSVDNRYLRKVTSVVNNNNEVTLQTQQVAMNEVFDDLRLQTKTTLYDPSTLNTANQALSRYKSYRYDAPTTQGYIWKSGKLAIEKNVPTPLNTQKQTKALINQEGSYIIISSVAEDEISVISGELLKVKILAELNSLSSSGFTQNDLNRVLSSFELISVEHDGQTSDNNFGFTLDVTTLNTDKKEGMVTFIATDTKASIQPYILKLKASAQWTDTAFFDTLKEDSEEIELHVYVLTKGVEASEKFSVSVEDDGKNTTYTLPVVATLPAIQNEVEGSYTLKSTVDVDVDFVPTIETDLRLQEKKIRIVAGGLMTLELDSLFEISDAMSRSYDINLSMMNKKFINVYVADSIPIYQEIDIRWKLLLKPSTEGAVNVSNRFTQVFDVNFGVDCNATECTPIHDNNNSSIYSTTIDLGNKSNLEVQLIPEITVTFYEATSVGITLEPWVSSTLKANGSATDADNFSNYAAWSSYSLDELNATVGIESNIFADLRIFDQSWFYYPSDASYKTIYSSIPKTIFSLPSVEITNLDDTQLIKNKDITLYASTQNGIGSHILEDSIEWFVYPSSGANISTLNTPYTVNVNVNTFGLYKVYCVANSNVLSASFGRQISEIEIDMRDEDGDGMADRWEEANGLNPLVDDSGLDKDADGYTNLTEYQSSTNANDENSYPNGAQDVNTPPIALAQTLTIEQDSLNNTIQLSGSDSDGDLLTYTVLTQPIHGSLSGNAPNLLYSPSSSYSGSDSFTFKVNDGTVDSEIVTVSIVVNMAGNQIPVADAGIDQSVFEGVEVTLDASKSSDDGAIVEYLWSEDGIELARSISFTKNDFGVGIHTLTLSVTDDKGASSTDEVIITINEIISPNHAPIASSQIISVEQDSSDNVITLNGSDIDTADVLTYILVTQPINGTVSGTAPNLLYTPTTSYSGSDSFTFKVNDGHIDSGVATIDININAPLIRTLSTVKKTGQVKSYDLNGVEVVDGTLKDDAYYQTGQQARYTRASDMVTDELTKLMWQDNAEVATLTKQWLTDVNYIACTNNTNSGACYDTSGDTAATYCSELNLGGYADWRLPSVEELEGILDYGKVSPAIDSGYFNNTSSNMYWSSNTGEDIQIYAWSVQFADGYVNGKYKYFDGHVRCVRNGE